MKTENIIAIAGNVRQPIALIILDEMLRLSSRSEKVTEALGKTLLPVMTCPHPQEVCDKALEDREYPPFFADLKDHISTINRAFNQIEEFIERAEL